MSQTGVDCCAAGGVADSAVCTALR
jgi:hypothetical protein